MERRKSISEKLSARSKEGSYKSDDGSEFIVKDEKEKQIEFEENLVSLIKEAKLVEDNEVKIEPILEEDNQSADYEEEVKNFFQKVNNNEVTD